MKLYQLVYVSDATQAMTAPSLEAMVARCRHNNDERNISGLLLHSRGHFIQLLEGHEPVLGNLFAKIKDDPRHHQVELLHFGPAQRRLFPKWRMGLLNLDKSDALDRARFKPFVAGLTKLQSGEAIIAMLREFRGQLANAGNAQNQAA